MSELRQNVATREWVIIATERAHRPTVYAEAPDRLLTEHHPPHDADCPFCPGNEERDLEIDRSPTEGDRRVRVVANKYPALHEETPLTRSFDGVKRRISGAGHHEVVVEHRQHNTTLALMKPSAVAQVLEMYYARGWEIQGDPRMEQIIFFKNHGQRAGASLTHPHSQIIALPVVPSHIRQRTEEARRYFDDTGDCVYCKILADELASGERLVAASEHFVAFVLYAASSPFHIWILPRRHNVSFLFTEPHERADLAALVRDVLRRIYRGLRDPAFNLIIRTAPAKEMHSDYLHWYVTLVLRLSRTAGFELGSGVFINPTLPEECAEFLRSISI